MHAVVVIPAYNEEDTVGEVISRIPRHIGGVDKVSVVVVDDGSADATRKAALTAGADIVHSFRSNRGLAMAFNKGVDLALDLQADIVVNIDADNQYDPSEIPKIIKPIVDEEADVVLTDRRVMSLAHMPFEKKWGNVVATWVLRKACGYPVSDGQSGFRAFTREAAMKINIQSDYTYVAESIIQLTNNYMKIVQLPCTFNARSGKSRLIRNIQTYAYRAGLTILRTHLNYKSLKSFTFIGALTMLAGSVPGILFLVQYLAGEGEGHIQSLILSTILLVIGFQTIILGLVSDSINSNRKRLEDIQYRLKEKR